MLARRTASNRCALLGLRRLAAHLNCFVYGPDPSTTGSVLLSYLVLEPYIPYHNVAISSVGSRRLRWERVHMRR